MAQVLQLRRGTTAENDIFTGAIAEITVDTDRSSIRVHDGVIPGGKEIVPVSVLRLVPIVEVSQSRSFTNDDTGKIFHFDTTSGSLNATFTGSGLSNGFNVTVVNTGLNAVVIAAPEGLNSIGTAVSEQYASAFVYALNGTIFATGRLV
jgi:hypothetical protein